MSALLVAKFVDRARGVLEIHSRACGDRAVGIVLHPDDYARLLVAETWDLPVLSSEHMQRGRLQLLCEARGVLIPEIHTFEDVLEQWQYRAPRGCT